MALHSSATMTFTWEMDQIIIDNSQLISPLKKRLQSKIK